MFSLMEIDAPCTFKEVTSPNKRHKRGLKSDSKNNLKATQNA